MESSAALDIRRSGIGASPVVNRRLRRAQIATGRVAHLRFCACTLHCLLLNARQRLFDNIIDPPADRKDLNQEKNETSCVKKRYRKKCKSAAASMVDSVLRMYVGVQGMEINRGIALPANGGRRTITCRGWVISVSQLSTRWCTMSWNQRLRFSVSPLSGKARDAVARHVLTIPVHSLVHIVEYFGPVHGFVWTFPYRKMDEANEKVVPLEDIISSQALFERFVQQQIGRGSDRSDLLGVMQAWPDASQTVSWLIVQSQLATNDTDALDLLMEAILTGSEAAHEILTMNLLAADLLHRRKRFLDAQRLLELARSLLVHRVDLCRIDSALGLLSRRHAVRVTPSIIMLPHMEVAISERARVAEHFSECRRPTDEEVRFFRDPFDGYEIDLLIDGDQHEALSEVRLGAYARYLTDGECLHVVVGDIANIGSWVALCSSR
ncbi:unnamed protein product (mitochondrion) [Plasmodiophora brassicae]|uniref:Uncharacterized protein n=1 Tax=Plasmodiophora brassicae TaxID=37360 RepID=A0A3P3YI44_PLABS|nr:unnamed protein product [Plasmodiophora brassicae]